MSELSSKYISLYRNQAEQQGYYLISLRPITNNEYYISAFTMWVGNQGKFEVRQVSPVKHDISSMHLSKLNTQVCTVNAQDELAALLKVGGHSLIRKEIIETNWKELIMPKIVVDTYDAGYLDYYSVIEPKHRGRLARNEYRMEILKRDQYRCRICGCSADDSVHIRLEVHHIKPWEEGGISTPQNLITLCATCHSGISVVDRDILYKKVGVSFPLENHKFYNVQNDWKIEQIRSYGYIVSNCITMKITRGNK